MRKILLSLAAIGCLFMLFSCSATNQPEADTIFINADAYTVNSKQPTAEAVAVKDGKILAVGTTQELNSYKGKSTNIVDCQGKFLMPGFIEGHGHIHGLGASLINLNLMHVKNWEEIVAMVAEAAKKARPGEWIIGRGWHQEKWDHVPANNFMGYPYHDDLDKVSPNNPVYLGHASGHSAYVNAKALELAQINASTQSPDGGVIVKDKNGRIVGVLEETAQALPMRAYDAWLNQQTEEQRKSKWAESIALAEQECLKKGITSFQDAGSSFEQVRWMQDLAAKHQFRIRHWVMVRESNANLRSHANVFPVINAGDGYLTVKAVKVSIDGALGSYGAWLLEPYTDRPGWVGQNTVNIDSLKAIADFCWNNNLQLCVHAIGDRANRETIDIFSEQIAKQKSKDHRWRVEHAQHVNPVEIPRFHEWNVIASMQAVHCTSDGPFVPKRLGDKRAAEGAYMWKAFLDAGVVVTNGTDVPVEDVDPIACYYSAVTRKMNNGQAFYPAQCMTREQALYSYTMANAFSSFQEKEKGSIETGKYADLVLLDNNLVNCNEDDIKKTKVLMTIVAGKVQYSSLNVK